MSMMKRINYLNWSTRYLDSSTRRYKPASKEKKRKRKKRKKGRASSEDHPTKSSSLNNSHKTSSHSLTTHQQWWPLTTKTPPPQRTSMRPEVHRPSWCGQIPPHSICIIHGSTLVLNHHHFPNSNKSGSRYPYCTKNNSLRRLRHRHLRPRVLTKSPLKRYSMRQRT